MKTKVLARFSRKTVVIIVNLSTNSIFLEIFCFPMYIDSKHCGRSTKNNAKSGFSTQSVCYKCILCIFAGQNSNNIVKNRVEIEKARGNTILEPCFNVNIIKIFSKKLRQLWLALRQLWLIRLRQLWLALRQLWFFATIVVGVTTIVVDCDNCEHCDNCDHIRAKNICRAIETICMLGPKIAYFSLKLTALSSFKDNLALNPRFLTKNWDNFLKVE